MKRPHSRWAKFNKYGNHTSVIDGHKFASKREATRYLELKLLADTGKITGLRLQVPFDLGVGDAKLKGKSGRQLRYVADFVYFDENGAQVIEDAKGMETPEYKLKRSIMEAQGYTITEV